MVPTVRRCCGVGVIGLAAMAAGCEPAPAAPHYKVLVGTVAASYPQTGELTVRVSTETPGVNQPKRVYCVVTRESEVYVNDRFASLDAIRIGDVVELVGYVDRDRQLAQFVVSLAYVRQPQPPAPDPATLLAPPATRRAQEP